MGGRRATDKFPQLFGGGATDRDFCQQSTGTGPSPRGCGSGPSRLVEPGRGRAGATVPGGGPPYFLCPFTCTRRMPVSLTHASNAALFSGFTLSHHS